MGELYLVKGTIHRTYYQGKSDSFDDQRLVRAESVEAAEEKYTAWWSAQTDEYSVYYRVRSCEVLETLE